MSGRSIFLPLAFMVGLMIFCQGRDADSIFGTPAQRDAWKVTAKSDIERWGKSANEEAIQELSDYVYKLNRQMNEPDLEDIRILATEALISIPGHAKFYQNKIESMKAQVIANEAKGADAYDEGDIGPSDYDSFRSNAFAKLQYIPSPETVSVLAHFLSDPEGREDQSRVKAESQRTVNCLYAAKDLNQLGIEKPPVQETLLLSNQWQQLDAWKDWWNEVKTGKRTYRFKGSPIEYGPDGPVSPKEISRREHDRPPATANATLDRPPVPSPNPTPVTEPADVGNSLAGKVAGGAALLLLLIGGWFAFGKRRAKVG